MRAKCHESEVADRPIRPFQGGAAILESVYTPIMDGANPRGPGGS
jgi:hypothetical protein